MFASLNIWTTILATLLAQPSYPAIESPCAFTFANAHVFTGTGFETRDLSVRDGLFSAGNQGLRRIDASALWIVPALVDAHTHTINAPEGIDDRSHRRWLDGGVYYSLNPNNIRAVGTTPAPLDSHVEYVAAGGGLTRPGGHPTQLYSGQEGMEGRAFHSVASPEQARAAVRRVSANGSRLVKLYLLNHTDPDGGSGLSADGFRAAVAEARRLGILPIVHIEDAADFRLAVSQRVHALMHMPYWPPSAEPRRAASTLMINSADAAAAAAAGVIVVPTVMLSAGQFDGPVLSEIMAVERHNLALLRQAGVRLAVGEDFVGDMHDEIAALRSFAIFEGPEMLRMATENGALLGFPGRRIGRLEVGYEASFLIYRRNPITNWMALRTPLSGMRGGRVIRDTDDLLRQACSGAPD